MNAKGIIEFKDIRVGASIPPVRFCPTEKEVFMFSAITWNRHHIHYSETAAREEGLPDIVVQRGLIGNYLAQLISHWVGSPGHMRELSWKMKNSAVPGQILVCSGEVVSIENAADSINIACYVKVATDSDTPISEGECLVSSQAFDSTRDME